MSTFDERGNVERKSGLGRPISLTKMAQKKLVKDVNHKDGVSQRKIANKYGVSQMTIGRTLNTNGIKYRKKIRVPKATPAQEVKQAERIHNLAQGDFSENDPRDILIDDESYFTKTGASLPGNAGFYTSDFNETPESVKFREDVKFEEKVMVWAMIARTGVSKIFVAGKKTDYGCRSLQK